MKAGYAALKSAARRAVATVAHSETNPGRSKAAESIVDSFFSLAERPLRRALRRPGLTPETVERRYDALAGTQARRFFGEERNEEVLYCVDGEPAAMARGAFLDLRAAEYAETLRGVPSGRVLEVGAGELTTLAALARHLPDREYVALETSFAAVRVGKALFEQQTGTPIRACKSNALALPFADGSFDVVFTAGCLAVMPREFERAIAEMLRVARSCVVLFEPTYELAGVVQRLRMHAHDYTRGIGTYVRTLPDVHVEGPWLLRHGDLHTRMAGMTLAKASPSARTNDAEYRCPACKGPLLAVGETLRCDDCRFVYPIVDEIPLLQDRNAVRLGPSLAAR